MDLADVGESPRLARDERHLRNAARQGRDVLMDHQRDDVEVVCFVLRVDDMEHQGVAQPSDKTPRAGTCRTRSPRRSCKLRWSAACEQQASPPSRTRRPQPRGPQRRLQSPMSLPCLGSSLSRVSSFLFGCEAEPGGRTPPASSYNGYCGVDGSAWVEGSCAAPTHPVGGLMFSQMIPLPDALYTVQHTLSALRQMLAVT